MLQKNIYKFSFLLAVLFIGNQAFSQGMKENLAKRLYNELAYYKAVEVYEELASRDKATTEQVRRTAECYRFIGNTKSAELWYSKLITRQDVTAEDYYYYAQMLKANENYLDANKQMMKFSEMSTDNSIAKAYKEAGKDYVNKLKINADRYEISNAGEYVNTVDGDFAPNYYKANGVSELIFASSRRNMSALNKKSQWDGGHFTDVYSVVLNNNWDITKKAKTFGSEVRSKYHEGPVSFSNNGTVMYLTRSNYLDKKKVLDSERHNNLQLYISKKEGKEWGELKPFKYNNPEYSIGHATVSEDGKTMYFVSDMKKSDASENNTSVGRKDIWKCVKTENGEWDYPQNVKEINTEGDEMFPHIGESGILYFASDGQIGLGGLDIFRAEPNGEGFSILNMGYPLNTNFDDFGFIVDANEEKGFFSSNRPQDGNIGGDDIFKVKILYPFGCVIKGIAVDSKTGDVLPGAEIKVVENASGNVMSKVVADEKGYFLIRKSTDKACKVIVEKNKYQTTTMYEFVKNDKCAIPKDTVKVALKKNDCAIVGTVTDAEQDNALEGVKVTVTNNKTGQTYEYGTDGAGQFKDALDGINCPEGLVDYTINFEKEGYFPKKIDFKYTLTKTGDVNINEFVAGKKIDMQKKKGDVKKFCRIDEILFDFNKDNIRPDAAAELDKLVACMKEYPEMRIEIGSHTDCQGKDAYNLKLSDKRAKASMRYVISQGIDESRIFGQGYGESRPVVVCKSCYKDCNESDYQKNRRTEFRIVSGGEDVENNSSKKGFD